MAGSLIFRNICYFLILTMKINGSSNQGNLDERCQYIDEKEQSLICNNISSVGQPNIYYSKKSRVDSLQFFEGSFDVLPCFILENLKKLQFHNVKIKQITSSSFKWTQNMKYLEFWNNGLVDLSENIFMYLTNLRVLNIVGTKLTRLIKGIFNGLQELRELKISYNDINQLPLDLFEYLISVTLIDLSHNNIEFLPPNLLEKNGELIKLDLSHNKLFHFNYSLFGNLAENKLEELDLRYNYLTEILYERWLEEHPRLKLVSLTGNPFNCSYKAKITEFFKSKRTEVFLDGCIDCNIDVNHEFHSKSCPESSLNNVSTPSIDIDYNVESTTPGFKDEEFSNGTNSTKNDTNISLTILIVIIGILLYYNNCAFI